MRILIFTLLCSLVSVGSLFAQDQEWNISSADFNALGEISATTTVNGLSIHATDAKKVVVDENGKEIDNMVFTHRLKLGGSGSIEAGSEYRTVSFELTGNATITVAAMSSSSSSDRELAYVNGTTGDTIYVFPALGESISKLDFEYVGDATTIYLFSKSSGINIYYIKTTTLAGEVVDPEPGVPMVWNISSANFNALGEIVATTTVDGLTIHATDAKKVVVDENGKEIDDLVFTHRLKLGGSGSIEAGAEYRAVSFDVSGDATITVAAMSSSSSSDRELAYVNGTTGDTIYVFPALGESISKLDFEYVGDATTIYLFSKSSGINIYYIATSYAADSSSIPDPNVILDPANYDASLLGDNVEIVDIDGTKYFKVLLNSWDNYIPASSFALPNNTIGFKCQVKYEVGTSGFAVENVNTFLKLRTPEGDEICAGGSASSTDFMEHTRDIADASLLVGDMQLAGQETSGWNAVVGDYLYVGKVEVIKYVDPEVILDPNDYDASLLAENVEIVDLDGEKYFKVLLNSWNNYIPANSVVLPEGTVGFKCMVKYEVGTSGYELSGINTFLKLRTPEGDEICASGAKSSAEFDEYKVGIADPTMIVGDMQVAGQETSGWGAVSGDYLYIGKVMADVQTEPVDPNVIMDPATFDAKVLNAGWEIAELDGEKVFKVRLNGWSSWTNIPEYTFPEGKNAFQASVRYAKGDAEYNIEEIKVFLKFSTAGWAEIGAASAPASGEFKDYVVTMAEPTGNVAGVFQVAGQEDVTGSGTALVGDYLFIGKVMAVTTAPVTFVVDDTKYKMYDGFSIRGSWNTDNGIFDDSWNGGVNHFTLTDSVDGVADNVWEATINLVADGGANVWKWGFLDLNDTWLVKGDDPEFTVVDGTPVTNTYVIGKTDVKDLDAYFKVYPNPAENVLNFSGSEILSVEVYNLTGSKVLCKQLSNSSIDISNLAQGTYLIRANERNGEVVMSKFSKR